MRARQSLGYRGRPPPASCRAVLSFSPPPALPRRACLRALAAGAWLAGRPGRAQPGLARTPLRLAVGGKTALCYLPLTVADQLRYFDDEGLDVELQDHAGGSLAQQALVQGQADMAAGAFEHTIVLRQRGLGGRAVVLLGRAPQLVFAVGARALPERDLRSLRGQRVGVTALDSSTQRFAQMLLARSGVAAGEVEFVGVGTSTAAVAAVRDGRVNAIANIDPVISLLEAAGDVRVLADTRSLRSAQALYGGPMPGACLYAGPDFVTRHPQTVQAVANAVVRALKWLQTAAPSDIVRTVPEAYMYGDRAVYLAALDKARAALSPDGLFADDAVATAHRVMALYAPVPAPGLVRAAAEPAATFTNDFARRARQKLQLP